MQLGGKMSCFCLWLCLWASSLTVFSQDISGAKKFVTDESELLKRLHSLPLTEARIPLYDSLCMLFKEKDFHKYLSYAEEAYIYSLAHGQEAEQLLFALRVGKGNLLQGRCVEGLDFLKACHANRTYTDDLLRVKMLNTLGAVYMCLGMYEEAQDHYLESIELSDNLEEYDATIEPLPKEKENSSLLQQISQNKQAFNQALWFGMLMTLLCILCLGMFMIFRKQKSDNTEISDILANDSNDFILGFYRKILISTFFLMIPVNLYLFFWKRYLMLLVGVGILFLAGYIGKYLKKLNYHVLEKFNPIVGYSIIFWVIYMIPSTPLTILIIFPTLLINALLIRSFRWQLFNFVMSFLAIIFYYYIAQGYGADVGIAEEQASDLFMLEVMLGAVTMYLLIMTLYFYRKYIHDYEQGLILQNQILSKTEKELRTSRSMYQTLYESMYDAVIVYDYKRDKVVEANPAAHDLFQFDGEKPITAYSKFDIIPQKSRYTGDLDLHKYVEDHRRKVLLGQKIKSPGIFVRQDKSMIFADVQVIPTMQNAGEGFVIIRDTTKHVQGQQQLKQSEKKFREIFDHSYQGILIFDLEEGRSTECNSRTLEIFGYSDKEEFLSTNFREFFEEKQLQGRNYEEVIRQVLEEVCLNAKSECTLLGKRMNGDTFIGELTAIMEEASSKTSILIFIHDVTERYKAQQEVEERKSIYQALIDHSFDGIDISEITEKGTGEGLFEGSLIERNSRLQEILDVKRDEPFVHKKSILSLAPEIQHNGEPSDAYLEKMTALLVEKRHIQCDWKVKGKGGKLLDVEMMAHLIEVQGKTLLIRIFKDITERRRQQKIIDRQLFDLNQKKEELEKYIDSNMQLENFAYIASHDLRAPLITIKSFAHLLQTRLDTKTDEKEKEFIQFIVSATENMQQLVEDLLEYSLVNNSERKWEDVRPANLINELLEELQSLILAKKAQVELIHLPEVIVADRIKIRQLFQNLIANALKFSRVDVVPVIRISCEQLDRRWVFSIQDNGIGIEPKFKERIFLLFKRLHNKSVYEGTGIGLALCKKIVEQHEGSIWVESEVGKGSTFFFEIPMVSRKQLTTRRGNLISA